MEKTKLLAYDVLVMLLNGTTRAIKGIFKAMPILINLINPFVAMGLTYHTYQIRGYWAVGGEMFIPILLFIVSYGLQTINSVVFDHIGDIPVSYKRFTRRDAKGNPQFNMDDLHQMIEYLAELEDVMDTHGKYRGGR